MMEMLPLTLPVLAGRACDCAGQEQKGREMGEMHCSIFERVNECNR